MNSLPEYSKEDEEMGANLLTDEKPKPIEETHYIQSPPKTLFWRVLFELVVRPIWGSICFSYTLSSCFLFVLLVVPPVGIPLMYLVLYSWRGLAIMDLKMNRYMITKIYESENKVVPRAFNTIPMMSMENVRMGNMDGLQALWSDKFTLRSFIYLVIAQFTMYIACAVIFSSMIAFLFFPLTWMAIGKWERVINELQRNIALLSYWVLAWNIDLDQIVPLPTQ